MTLESRPQPPGPSASATGASERHWLDALFARLSFLVPLLVTVFRASSAPLWRDDLPVVRALGLLPAGGEGGLSNVLIGFSSLLPLGGRVLRASWASAFALALASHLVYLLARRVLDLRVSTPRLTPGLCLAAALTATLAQSFQLEGTAAGGATLATALVLLGLLLGVEAVKRQDARIGLGLGALSGLTLCESHAAALVLLCALFLLGAMHGFLPRGRSVLGFLAALFAVEAFSLLPLLLRPLAAHGGIDFGHGLDASSLGVLDAESPRVSALGVWLNDMGMISFSLAIGGLVLGLWRRTTRRTVAPLLVLVLADLALPVSRVSRLTPDAFGSLRLLALVAFAVCAALAVQSSAVALMRARIPFAEAASVLLVVFDFSLVFLAAEDSAYAAQGRGAAAEEWTDRALASAPPGSLLLLRSEAIAWRLLSARVVRGERPDMVLVPMPLLARGNVRARLLQSEPALAPLIRELALSGRPSEYALSSLADARPLLVEFDPDFDHAQLEHLIPTPFFMHFAAEPRGRSDRLVGALAGAAGFQQVLAASDHDGARDEATRSVLLGDSHAQALLAAALGDRANLDAALAAARALDENDTLGENLAAQSKSKPRLQLSLARFLPLPGGRAL